MILCSNPKAQYLAHQQEIDDALARVLHSGWYILGHEVEQFEQEFAQYIGVAHAVGVGSGTEAIHVALGACDIEKGDEIITVSHTAVATVSAIVCAGATPVLVDIEPDTFSIDPHKIKAAITARTKAIVVVHLYGHPAHLDPILDLAKAHDLRVIEDCAQAHGARYKDRAVGSYGDMACFSFYPTKNLGALGDGGMVVTDNRVLAEKALHLRQYGWAERHISHTQGWNSRLDEIQAAILRVKLKHLDQDNAKRIAIAAQYNEALNALDVILPQCRVDCRHVYHLYVLRTQRRDELLIHLKQQGIGAAIHYPAPVHLQPAYRHLCPEDGLPQTTRTTQEILSLPMYPELNENDVTQIVSAIQNFFMQV